MEIHGMKNDVVCAMEVLPAYIDANAPGFTVPLQDWLSAQEVCNMCTTGTDGPCPHGPEDPREDN